MNKFNKCVFIFCIAALGSACKSSGGGSTNAESLSSQGQGQEKWRSSSNRSSNYRGSYRNRSNNRRTTPKRVATPRPAPTPVATPQPAPTPVVVRPEPRPAPAPTPIAQVPAPTPQPAPEPVTAPTVIGNAQLSWSIPTKRENGDSLAPSELSRYEVYYTSDSGKSDTIKITNTSSTAYTVKNLEGDTYYFAMAAVDKDGIFSELSNEVPKVIK